VFFSFLVFSERSDFFLRRRFPRFKRSHSSLCRSPSAHNLLSRKEMVPSLCESAVLERLALLDPPLLRRVVVGPLFFFLPIRDLNPDERGRKEVSSSKVHRLSADLENRADVLLVLVEASVFFIPLAESYSSFSSCPTRRFFGQMIFNPSPLWKSFLFPLRRIPFSLGKEVTVPRRLQ